MSQYRVIKNRTRFGKPWLLVKGDYLSWNAVMLGSDGKRWVTAFSISEHRTKAEAEAAEREWQAKQPA